MGYYLMPAAGGKPASFLDAMSPEATAALHAKAKENYKQEKELLSKLGKRREHPMDCELGDYVPLPYMEAALGSLPPDPFGHAIAFNGRVFKFACGSYVRVS